MLVAHGGHVGTVGWMVPGRRAERTFAGLDEDAIKEALSAELPKWFRVRREVCGVHPTEGRVRIDFACHPTDELIDAGWVDGTFGVEVKHAPADLKTALNVARQAHLYTEATYRVDQGPEFRLDFVCVCPSFVRMLGEYEPCWPEHAGRFAAKFKVGELILNGHGLAIYFSHQHLYFDTARGMSGTNPLIKATRVSR